MQRTFIVASVLMLLPAIATPGVAKVCETEARSYVDAADTATDIVASAQSHLLYCLNANAQQAGSLFGGQPIDTGGGVTWIKIPDYLVDYFSRSDLKDLIRDGQLANDGKSVSSGDALNAIRDAQRLNTIDLGPTLDLNNTFDMPATDGN
jgi:hypothetical protein